MNRCTVNRIALTLISLISVWDSIAQTNDNCAGAVVLPLTTQCTSRNFSTQHATAEPLSIAPDPSCPSYAGSDVWFKLALPPSGGLRIEVDNLNGATPPSFAVYAGSCGMFSELSCVANDKGKTVFQPELAGDTVYLRVYRFFSASSIDFSLCAFEPAIPGNDLCANAERIEVGQTCVPVSYSNAYATAEPDNIAPNSSCGFYKGGDIWFSTTMPPSGTLRINKTRITGAANPIMSLYTGSCGAFTELLCSENDAVETFINPKLAGEEIFIRIHTFNSEEGFAFSLCLYEQGNPINDACEHAQELPTTSGCTWMQATTFLADGQPSAIAPDPSCGSYRGSDVWYKFQIPNSGRLNMNLESVQGTVPPSFALYAGNCGNFNELICVENKTRYTLDLPTLANEIIYMRIYPFNTDEGGPFSICLYEDQVVSVDENTTTAATTFPNPVSNVLKVSIPGRTTGGIFELIDLTGRTVQRGALSSEDIQHIDMTQHAGGTYLLKLFTGHETSVIKVTKSP